MAKLFNQILTSIDGFVWGVPPVSYTHLRAHET